MKEYVIAFIVSILSFFIPVVPLLLLVGLFICLDTILGIWACKRQGEKITSHKLSAMIPKMFLYQGAVMTGYLVDVFLLGEFIGLVFDIPLLFTKLIAMTLIFIEGVSLDENWQKIKGKTFIQSFKEMVFQVTSLKKDIQNLGED